MHVDANKASPHTPTHTPTSCNSQLPLWQTAPGRRCLSYCSHLQNFGEHKFLSVLYGSWCLCLAGGARDAFRNSCKLNLLRRACAQLMTLVAKLASRYFRLRGNKQFLTANCRATIREQTQPNPTQTPLTHCWPLSNSCSCFPFAALA